MSVSIVLGLAFGDEGKGLTTSFLATNRANPLVIRFNGGHQAGHTVTNDRHRHTFSSFGSGTLNGIPSFWSKNCTVSPIALMNEYSALKANGYKPILTLDPDCPITTPYDENHNRIVEDAVQHGSVGVGFGSTIQREEKFYHLRVRDLFFKTVFEAKLDLVRKYYNNPESEWLEKRLKEFHSAIQKMSFVFVNSFQDTALRYNDLIFEGAQGILLDMDYGFFPNVTRSNTTSKKAIEMIREYSQMSEPEIYYVTRCYQTRHGNGHMTNEGLAPELDFGNFPETNVTGKYQGKFRTGALDIDLLRYALNVDKQFHSYGTKTNLVVTCLDQVQEEFIPYSYYGVMTSGGIRSITNKLGFKQFFGSNTPYSGLTLVKPLNLGNETQLSH